MNAVMIMCHKNYGQVKRLIERVKSTETLIFVHFDKNMAINEKDIDILTKDEDVFLTDYRIHGVLDTRSLVDITMLLIDKAINASKKQSN